MGIKMMLLGIAVILAGIALSISNIFAFVGGVPFFYKPRYRKHQSAILVPKKELHPLFHDGKFRDALRWMLIH